MSGSFESVRWNACVHRLDLSLYSHPKEFWGNGVRTHVNSMGKISSTRKISPKNIENRTWHQAGQGDQHYQHAIPSRLKHVLSYVHSISNEEREACSLDLMKIPLQYGLCLGAFAPISFRLGMM